MTLLAVSRCQAIVAARDEPYTVARVLDRCLLGAPRTAAVAIAATEVREVEPHIQVPLSPRESQAGYRGVHPSPTAGRYPGGLQGQRGEQSGPTDATHPQPAPGAALPSESVPPAAIPRRPRRRCRHRVCTRRRRRRAVRRRPRGATARAASHARQPSDAYDTIAPPKSTTFRYVSSFYMYEGRNSQFDDT